MQTRLEDFESIQQQFEEHLTAINETTSEIQALFDYLHQIEIKVDKVVQRLDAMQLSQSQPEAKLGSFSLTQLEKQIFLALYTEETPLSYKEIAIKAQLPESLIPECISALVDKGIPFQRVFYHDRLFLKIESRFKELQAKHNLINVSLESFIE